MNIIYFNPDELRADTLGCYGHPLVKTPNIDRLAAQGVTFDQCHVQHTVCSPSRCSFMTGTYPHTNGHRSLWHLLQPCEPNTMKYLKENGYNVVWNGKNDVLATESFADCVSEIRKPAPGPIGKEERLYDDPDHPGYMNFLYKPMNGHHSDYYRCVDSADFIRSWKPGDKPFFLFLPLCLPHCPYTAPEPYYSMYSPDDIPSLLAERVDKAPMFHKWIKHYRRLHKNSEQDMKKIMAVYLGMVSYLDEMFGLVFDAVEQSAAVDNTAIFFFSDHGDWAGDYGLVEKWPSALDDRLTRVPLIIKTPYCKAGHRVKEVMELFDIAPATAELANYELQHTQYGQSLTSQLRGAPGDPERAAFAEGGYDRDADLICFEDIEGGSGYTICDEPESIYFPKGLQQKEQSKSVCRSVMIRTSKYKLIRREQDTNELYDLVKDPGELNNLYNNIKYTDMQAQLNERLLLWYLKTSDTSPRKRDERNTPEKFKSNLI